MQRKQSTRIKDRPGPRGRVKAHPLHAVAFLAVILGSVVLGASDAGAVSCEAERVPCVAVKFGAPEGGGLSVEPGLAYYDSTRFYIPVEIAMKYVNRYTVKVYSSTSNLESDKDIIPSVISDTSYATLGKNGSEWGIRWTFGDSVDNDIVADDNASYHKVPASAEDTASIVKENEPLSQAINLITKQLTLGFAVAVNAEQPSGEYKNTVTVAVVASPRDARSFFDISDMQEMTTEICENTTTPNKSATTKFDTKGLHPGDTSYVPETTLTDTRDGKSYLVRKLADGNCWMSQNLSLALDASQELTNEDTDLNSKESWVPGNSTEPNPGTKWGENDGIVHSLSYGWDQYWTGGTNNAAFNSDGADAYGGKVGYAQRGNYYNWFAATAGSGTKDDINTTTADGEKGRRIINGTTQDSICPKGWTLPVGGDTNAYDKTDGSVKSFYNLVRLYTNIASNSSGNTSILYASPMHFVPAGYYYYRDGSITATAGIEQFYGSATAAPSKESNTNLNLYLNIVYPGTGTNYKGSGSSIRCVSR